MSDIITARDLAMVTSDIQYAQRQGARQLASNLIEIGRLLVEARTMVEPKDWEKYIWDNFGYSTSSADNWIKLYKEYGNDQESLFDSFTNSQTFGRMSYTKLLALTAIPAEEREDFVAQHDVEGMSTRQLQQAIKERDEEKRLREQADDQIVDLQRKNETLIVEANTLRNKTEQLAKNETDLNRKIAKLRKQLADAQGREEAARADLKKAQENPSVPDSVMEQMRAEVEADAAQRATADVQKQLAAAQQQAVDAAKAREAAEAAARDAEAKLVAAQKASKLANPDVMAVNVLAQKLLEDWKVILNRRGSAISTDLNNAAPIDAFLNKILDTMRCGIAAL